jgi:hypothetical protein
MSPTSMSSLVTYFTPTPQPANSRLSPAPLKTRLTPRLIVWPFVSSRRGTLELSDPEDSVFRAAKVGLGALGIVSELTLKCIPQHRLLEHTYTTTPRQVRLTQQYYYYVIYRQGRVDVHVLG